MTGPNAGPTTSNARLYRVTVNANNDVLLDLVVTLTPQDLVEESDYDGVGALFYDEADGNLIFFAEFTTGTDSNVVKVDSNTGAVLWRTRVTVSVASQYATKGSRLQGTTLGYVDSTSTRWFHLHP